MNPLSRTVLFVTAAIFSVAGAVVTHYAQQPAPFEFIAPIGEPFYPNFTKADVVTGVRVVRFNTEQLKPQKFEVSLTDGVFRIPTHHNYPCDGKDRLKNTASSLIGLTRAAYIERSPEAHARYEVVDPLDEKSDAKEGRGQRVTLFNDKKEAVADLIIGKRAERTSGGPDAAETYYVRRPDEDQIYLADMAKLDISTKFVDWIQSDLLDLAANDIRKISIAKHSIREGTIEHGQDSHLSRKDDKAEWQLEDLDPETEKLKTSVIGEMVKALDDLKIVGVRKKPDGLSKDLKGDSGSMRLRAAAR